MKEPKNIARDGAPKKLHVASVHGGMQFNMRHGQLIQSYAGVSKTQVAHPLQDEPMIHEPTVLKRLAPVMPVIGQRSRISTAIGTLPDKCKFST